LQGASCPLASLPQWVFFLLLSAQAIDSGLCIHLFSCSIKTNFNFPWSCPSILSGWHETCNGLPTSRAPRHHPLAFAYPLAAGSPQSLSPVPPSCHDRRALPCRLRCLVHLTYTSSIYVVCTPVCPRSALFFFLQLLGIPAFAEAAAAPLWPGFALARI
jgi:hypothetical protein